jgi:hypothetical protein
MLRTATQNPLVAEGRHVDAAVVQIVAWFTVAADLTVDAGVNVSEPEIDGGRAFVPPSVIVMTHGAAVDSVKVELVYAAFAPMVGPFSTPTEYGALLSRQGVMLESPMTIDPLAQTQTAIGLLGSSGFWLNVIVILSLQSTLPVTGTGDNVHWEAAFALESAVAASPSCNAGSAVSAVHTVADVLTSL